MYYESKWELIVERSVDTQKNVKLMKFVTLSIVTNRNAFHFTGLNFFNVSLNSVVAVSVCERNFKNQMPSMKHFLLQVLKGAGSYFTFLISLR